MTALGVACAAYCIATVIIAWQAYLAADHHWIYALDDPYIAMAMAKSLSQHGVWGITQFGFTSSSSSPLFTVVLAILYRLFGVNIWTPLAISWLSGLATIFVSNRIIERYIVDTAHRTLALIAFGVATPLYAIGLVGMENSLHMLLVLLFLLWMDEGCQLQLGLVSGLMIVARYESVFVLAPACLVMAYIRRWREMVSCIAGAMLAASSYGIYSIAHGGEFLPNSVLIKGVESGLSPVFLGIIINLLQGASLLFLVLMLLVASVQLWNRERRLATLAFVVAIAGIGHMAGARMGSSYRYEAYIVGSAALAVVCIAPRLSIFSNAGKYAFSILGLMATCAVCYRSIDAAVSMPQYSRGIYLQQWQMARFLSTYLPQSFVAANDIGAISYFTDIHCTDLVGLADADIFAVKKAHAYTTDFVRMLGARRGVQITLVYDSWFKGVNPLFFVSGPRLPQEWALVGKLTTPKTANLGAATVSFYAVQPQKAQQIRDSLMEFRSSLPSADRLDIFPGPQK